MFHLIDKDAIGGLSSRQQRDVIMAGERLTHDKPMICTKLAACFPVHSL
jgi:hypothetical protein